VAKYHHTQGVCLRRLDYSNTSLLTPNVGRLSFIAKGATRAPKKGVRTGFDLLGLYDVVYTARRPGSLQNLTERSLREGFRGMRRSIERIMHGYYAAELVLNTTPEGQPCPELYGVLLRALHGFDSGDGLERHALMLEMAGLKELGICPHFRHCAACGRPLPERGPMCFSPASGGPVCNTCEPALPPGPGGSTTIVGSDLLCALAQLEATRPARWVDMEVAPDRARTMSAILRFHVRYVLGKELRMWKYLQRDRLGQDIRRARRAAGVR